MNTNTTGSTGGQAALVDYNDSMEEFDKLPPELREKLRYMILHWSARFINTQLLPHARAHAPSNPIAAVLRYLEYDNRKAHDVAAHDGLLPRQQTLRVERLRPGNKTRYNVGARPTGRVRVSP